jgi:hypothetical protein
VMEWVAQEPYLAAGLIHCVIIRPLAVALGLHDS